MVVFGSARSGRWGRARGPDDARPAALHHRGLGGRRQEHADRAAAVRLQAGLRGPARARRPGERAPRRDGSARPGAADRRAARRARAGDHDRRGLPLLRDGEAAVHHRRLPRAPAVHAQHGDRRLDGRPGGDPAGRAQGACWSSPSATPSSARCWASRTWSWRSTRWTSWGTPSERFDELVVEFAGFAAKLGGRAKLVYIPISALEGDNVVERSARMEWYDGPAAAGAAGAGRGGLRPPPRHAGALPGAVGDPPVESDLAQPLPLPRASDYRGYAGQLASGALRVGRGGGGAAERAAHADRRDRHLRRARWRRRWRRCR